MGNASSGPAACQAAPSADETILGDPFLKPGPRNTLFWLWREAGQQPNLITTNKESLAAASRQDLRTIERHVKDLAAAGRVTIAEWDPDSGAITLYIWRPTRERPPATFDPQKRLAFERAEEVDRALGQVRANLSKEGKLGQVCASWRKLVQAPHYTPRMRGPVWYWYWYWTVWTV